MHQELYVVLGGRAELVLDGQPHDCPRGTCIAIPDPQVKRSAIAVEAGTTVLVIGATSGEIFEVSKWDDKWTTGLPQA